MEINNIGRKWIVKEPGNPATVRRLAQELGTDPVLANLLVQRGINTYEEARTFFRPDLSMLHDPFLMQDMDKAVERLHRLKPLHGPAHPAALRHLRGRGCVQGLHRKIPPGQGRLDPKDRGLNNENTRADKMHGCFL